MRFPIRIDLNFGMQYFQNFLINSLHNLLSRLGSISIPIRLSFDQSLKKITTNSTRSIKI